MSGEDPTLVAPCRYCARVGEWAGFDACSECVLVAKAARDERWDDMAVHMQEIVAAIRAEERAAWTKAIIGVAEEWSKQDAPDRPADLRALVEEARGGE